VHGEGAGHARLGKVGIRQRGADQLRFADLDRDGVELAFAILLSKPSVAQIGIE
jgi:hypothetical protein